MLLFTDMNSSGIVCFWSGIRAVVSYQLPLLCRLVLLFLDQIKREKGVW